MRRYVALTLRARAPTTTRFGFALAATLSLTAAGSFLFAAEGDGDAAPAPKTSGPSRAPTKPEKAPSRASGAHILVQWAGLDGATTTRSKAEAKARATALLERARDSSVDFAELARSESDDPQSGPRGGLLGILPKRLRPEFQPIADALYGMEVGQVADPVETPMGIHILLRQAIVEYAASHILIQYQGSERAGPDITRSREEAKAHAEDIVAKARAKDADFAALAREHSDGPTGPNGGSLGIFGAGQMTPAFEAAVEKLGVGEIAGPVETEFGFHVIRRDAIDRVAASHILIQHAGSSRSTSDRSKEEARAIAENVLASLRAGEIGFADAAKKHSDGPSAPDGGDLGLFERDQMVKPFSDAAFSLEVGGLSDVVETDFGFHIILRTE